MTMLAEAWSIEPVFQAQRIQKPKQRHLLSRLLLGYFLSAGSVSAAVVWVEIVYWPFPAFTLELASADIAQTNRQTKANKLTELESRAPHLGFQTSSGPVNEPLPLNITLNNGSGGETLVLTGLPASAKLSAGVDLGSTRWSVLGRDLGYAFIAAPENFSGSIQLTATLYSADNAVLETRNISYEWKDGHTENQSGTVGVAAGAQEIADLTAEDRNTIRTANRISPVMAFGADTPPSIKHSQSPAPKWHMLGLDSSDWASQVTFGEEPLAQFSALRAPHLKGDHH